MIPKIIHYCWFGKGLIPQSQKKCIEGWKKLMPDYQFILWDESTFNVNICDFTVAAYKKKKYAYVADVARLYALSEYGGIYLDTDVEVFKRFDDFLKYDFFTGIEIYEDFYTDHVAEQYLYSDGSPRDPAKDVPKCEILTSTIASCPQCMVINDLKDYYLNVRVTHDLIEDFRKYINYDRLFARYLVHYGFKYVDATQYLDNNMVVFGTGTFGYMWSPNSNYTVSFHHNAMTWDAEAWSKAYKKRVKLDKLGLLPLYERFKRIKNSLRKK